MSPTIKIIIILFSSIVLIKIFRKYIKNKTSLALDMTLLFSFYILAVLFSSFDVLLNWQNILGSDTFLGMGLAFLMSGIGNIFYVWMIINVYYVKTDWGQKDKLLFLLMIIGELGCTGAGLYFRIIKESLASIFIMLHMLLGLVIYILMLKNSITMMHSVTEKKLKSRFKNIGFSAFWLIISTIMFVIDSLFVEFTIYSLIGWIMILLMTFNLYKSYAI